MPVTDNGKAPTMAILKQHLNEQITAFFFSQINFSPFVCVLTFSVFWGREKVGKEVIYRNVCI